MCVCGVCVCVCGMCVCGCTCVCVVYVCVCGMWVDGCTGVCVVCVGVRVRDCCYSTYSCFQVVYKYKLVHGPDICGHLPTHTHTGTSMFFNCKSILMALCSCCPIVLNFV